MKIEETDTITRIKSTIPAIAKWLRSEAIDMSFALPDKAVMAMAGAIEAWKASLAIQNHPSPDYAAELKALDGLIAALEAIIPTIEPGGNMGEPDTCPRALHETYLAATRAHRSLVYALARQWERNGYTSILSLSSMKHAYAWQIPIKRAASGPKANSFPTPCLLFVLNRILQESGHGTSDIERAEIIAILLQAFPELNCQGSRAVIASQLSKCPKPYSVTPL